MAPTTKTQETTADPAPAATAEPTVAEQLDRAQCGLLTVINDAVSPSTGHGVDITFARQAAEVYTILFGGAR